ncbi:MAG: hypothetical protein CMG93_04790 [Marinomonas sp.]|jgi:predicted small integral membrane protein|uniref:Putative small integral membrane protein n=1 Tax=Marinomonas communis TaxID=28254 RepID=A0A4V3DGU6_9GAMM|nr:DUF2160 domain-containing protein [Marinomonas communis]MAF14793.1 hypothetical protein [Marinomonas sp.]MEC8080288.1 DUF2160 domain-containing protein [Pseudomonadota bacterium]MAF15277.1 hypothetical protein [Marinomonas sp.]MCC4273041.1 DUF2160 domain-containing protein [Marinomonas communis]RUM48808.1 MAG: hypothetical protein DSY85_16970 [Marinomonas sp.]|tara:strand:+ start:203 stop:475 length:273 start_codon:yes stop_codon:yes gene_type:complete
MVWMSWTLPTAAFFAGIALILVAMTTWQAISPSVERKGFLPIETTRGDRLFIGLLSSAFVHLGFVALSDVPLYVATALCVLWMCFLMRWG